MISLLNFLQRKLKLRCIRLSTLFQELKELAKHYKSADEEDFTGMLTRQDALHGWKFAFYLLRIPSYKECSDERCPVICVSANCFVFDHNNDNNFMWLNLDRLTVYCWLCSVLSGLCEGWLIGRCETLPCLRGVPYQPIKIGINLPKTSWVYFAMQNNLWSNYLCQNVGWQSTIPRVSQQLADVFV